MDLDCAGCMSYDCFGSAVSFFNVPADHWYHPRVTDLSCGYSYDAIDQSVYLQQIDLSLHDTAPEEAVPLIYDPVTELLRLVPSRGEAPVRISVLDNRGSTVLQDDHPSADLSVAHIASGLYAAVVWSRAGTSSIRFIRR